MKRAVVVAMVMLFVLPTLVSAATWDQAVGIGVSLSAVKPWAGEYDKAAIGSLYGANLKYAPTPYTMLGLDFGMGSHQPVEAGSTWKADKNSPFETKMFPVNASIRVTPFAESAIKPYVIFGIGALVWDLQNSSAAVKSVYGQKTDLTLSSGIGFEVFPTQRLGIDFLLRGLTATSLKEDNVGRAYDVNRNFAEARLGVNFYFGMNLDKDKDGIKDKQDKCPNEAEDFDGFQDQDGCPDPDNDGDGILDVNDKCPNEAEDFDGFQDQDGCPDPDNDGDGILDVNDKCPNQAETFNGFEDEDGCPDKKPMPQLQEKGAKLILQGVNFETASAELTTDSKVILDNVAIGLIDNPEVEIEIRGYTDNVGRASSNQKLSEARANSVMQYLIGKGVAASRMTAKGFGPKDPIATNATPEGRAQNRRIEFIRSK